MSGEKRFLIGGNWKANGTVAQAKEIVEFLNAGGPFPTEAEVVIAPPAHLLGLVKDTVREDIGTWVRALCSVRAAVRGARRHSLFYLVSPFPLRAHQHPHPTTPIQRWRPRTRR
jgi:hypothetical protein